jgi:hypothetical protein
MSKTMSRRLIAAAATALIVGATASVASAANTSQSALMDRVLAGTGLPGAVSLASSCGDTLKSPLGY